MILAAFDLVPVGAFVGILASTVVIGGAVGHLVEGWRKERVAERDAEHDAAKLAAHRLERVELRVLGRPEDDLYPAIPGIEDQVERITTQLSALEAHQAQSNAQFAEQIAKGQAEGAKNSAATNELTNNVHALTERVTRIEGNHA